MINVPRKKTYHLSNLCHCVLMEENYGTYNKLSGKTRHFNVKYCVGASWCVFLTNKCEKFHQKKKLSSETFCVIKQLYIYSWSSSPGRGTSSRPFLGPPSLISNRYRVNFRRGQSGRSVKLTARLQLVPKSRIPGSIHPLPHTSSWRSA
jgi:hypothetical protein